jgi:NAD(P)-dependent dehydrogenase (short-subunit alcohol dehydrogenase family)
VAPRGRTVLLTGADSGLGAACGAQLVALGHRVVAACLTEEGRARAAQWPGAGSVVALLVDVTSDSDVAAMAVAADAACGADGLYCVVNCAGLMLPAPIEWAALEKMAHEMNVNYLGLVRVAKATVPLLRRYGRGARFVGVTSMIGLMPHIMGLSGYASSKHAAECFVNSLRAEMSVWGIDVMNVCPGTTQTPFLAGADEKVRSQWAAAPQEVRDAYGPAFFDWFVTRTFQGITYLSSPPGDAENEMLHAVTARWPKTRYYTGLDSRLLGRWAVHLFDWIYDGGMAVAFNAFRPTPQALLQPKSRL